MMGRKDWREPEENEMDWKDKKIKHLSEELEETKKELKLKTAQYKAAKEDIPFYINALNELKEPAKVEPLKGRKYKVLYIGHQDYPEWGFDKELEIIEIPEDVDLFDPIKVELDEGLDDYVEELKGGFKIIPGIASAIRKLKREADEEAQKRPAPTDAEKKALMLLKDAGFSYGEISGITGRPTGTIKAIISKERKKQGKNTTTPARTTRNQ